jgi:hypothetical protein
MDEFDEELLATHSFQQAMNKAGKEQALYDDVKALHKALNAVLALYVIDNGYGDHCVEIGLQALARHPELPVRASLAEKIEKRGASRHE